MAPCAKRFPDIGPQRICSVFRQLRLQWSTKVQGAGVEFISHVVIKIVWTGDKAVRRSVACRVSLGHTRMVKSRCYVFSPTSSAVSNFTACHSKKRTGHLQTEGFHPANFFRHCARLFFSLTSSNGTSPCASGLIIAGRCRLICVHFGGVYARRTGGRRSRSQG